MVISRRRMLIGAAMAGSGMVAFNVLGRAGAAQARDFPLTLTDAQWRARLTPQQYAILRKKSTEYPFTSPLNKEHRKGTFRCAGCALPLFSSATKYDSGTGWPSFWQHLPKAVRTQTDLDLGYPRTEVHCARCGGHLGHVFDDGPRPTGKRYCMNGAAMTFVPA